jgi:hypothetical protein
VRRLIVALLLCAPACGPKPTPNPPVPAVDAGADTRPDAAPPVIVGAGCAPACAVLSWLGCVEGRPTPNGDSCDAVCERARAFPNFSLPTACISTARTVGAVRACGVKCAQ